MNNYVKGRMLEYKVKKYLESLGWTVFRCAGSKPLDLIAIRDGKAIAVECKASPYDAECFLITDAKDWSERLKVPVVVYFPDNGCLNHFLVVPRGNDYE
ncbi:MAG: hypothetical protein QXI39_00285 [Candidatus Bathyarchaeia archaeon]